MKKDSPQARTWTLSSVGFYIVAVLIALWTLVPIILIAFAAFTSRTELYTWPRSIIPTSFSLESLRYFANAHGVLKSTSNSILVAIVTITISLAVGAPAGYALSRFRFPGKEGFKLGILITRMFPVSLLAIPLAVMFLRWNVYDTILGVSLMHTSLCLPFTVLITAGLFMKIPYDLEEAAMTLGCNRITAFIRISLPMALPGLAAAGIFTFVTSWNEVFASSILTVQNRTLPAHIMATLEASPLNFKFAGGFFMIIPAVVFIFIIRKYLLSMWGVSINK